MVLCSTGSLSPEQPIDLHGPAMDVAWPSGGDEISVADDKATLQCVHVVALRAAGAGIKIVVGGESSPYFVLGRDPWVRAVIVAHPQPREVVTGHFQSIDERRYLAAMEHGMAIRAFGPRENQHSMTLLALLALLAHRAQAESRVSRY